MQYKIYQCNNEKGKTRITHKYNRIYFTNKQTVKVNDPQMVKLLDGHPSFREVQYTIKTLRLSPSIEQILPAPIDPYQMNKDDVINELRSYGVKVDQYQMSNTLSFQLQTVRGLMKRSYVTVLSESGNPVYVENINVDEPAVEIHKVEKKEQEEVSLARKKTKDGNVEGTVMAIEPVVDEYECEKKEIGELIDELTDNTKERVEVDVEKEMEDFSFKSNFEKVDDGTIQRTYDKDIVCEDFSHLVYGNICKLEVKPEEYESLRQFKWNTIPTPALERFLTYYKIDFPPKSSDANRKRELAFLVKQFIANSDERERITIEICMLGRRCRELDKQEPNYKNSTVRAMKGNIAHLSKYGYAVKYDKSMLRTNLVKLSKRFYFFARLGEEIPETEEEMNEKIIAYGYGSTFGLI